MSKFKSNSKKNMCQLSGVNRFNNELLKGAFRTPVVGKKQECFLNGGNWKML